MRITTSMIQRNVLADLNGLSEKLARTQGRASSGKEITRASDNPWAKQINALGQLHTTEVGGAKPGTLSVTRAEVATFCLDCVDENAWVHRAPIIWNGRGSTSS